MHDLTLRQAWRSVRIRWRFSLAAVAVMATGIAACLAVTWLLGAASPGGLPYQRVDRLAVVESERALVTLLRNRRWDFEPLPELATNPRIQAAGAAISGGVNIGGEPAIRASAAAVSDDFFSTLQPTAQRGRFFGPDDLASSRRVVVIGEELWRRRFDAREDLQALTLMINGANYQVVGVLPRGFAFPTMADLWIPRGVDPQLGGELPSTTVVLRLRDGVPLSEMNDVMAQLYRQTFRFADSAATNATVITLHEWLLGRANNVLWILLAGAALVLLVACVNVSGFLRVRLLGSSAEFAVRRALGASRHDLGALILAENLLLSFGAALVAIPLVIWLVSAVRAIVPFLDVSVAAVNWWFVTTAALLPLLTAGIASAIPMLALNNLNISASLLSSRTATESLDRSWGRSVGVMAQVAAAVCLTTAAATLVDNALRDWHANVGVDSTGLFVAQVQLPDSEYATMEAVARFYETFESAILHLPGVVAVGSTSTLPGGAVPTAYVRRIHVEGFDKLTSSALDLAATPGYFDAMRINILVGRDFLASDGSLPEPVAIVSAGVARALGVSADELLGRRIDLTPAMPWRTWARIVGITETDVAVEVGDTLRPAVYVPLQKRAMRGPAFTAIRAATSTDELARVLDRVVRSIDPNVPLYNAASFVQHRRRLQPEREVAMSSLIVCSVLVGFLASVGVLATIASWVRTRSRELAIRSALGATPWRLRGHALRAALLPAIIGALLGSGCFVLVWPFAAQAQPHLGLVNGRLVVLVSVCALSLLAVLGGLSAWRASRVGSLTHSEN